MRLAFSSISMSPFLWTIILGHSISLILSVSSNFFPSTPFHKINGRQQQHSMHEPALVYPVYRRENFSDPEKNSTRNLSPKQQTKVSVVSSKLTNVMKTNENFWSKVKYDWRSKNLPIQKRLDFGFAKAVIGIVTGINLTINLFQLLSQRAKAMYLILKLMQDEANHYHKYVPNHNEYDKDHDYKDGGYEFQFQKSFDADSMAKDMNLFSGSAKNEATTKQKNLASYKSIDPGFKDPLKFQQQQQQPQQQVPNPAPSPLLRIVDNNQNKEQMQNKAKEKPPPQDQMEASASEQVKMYQSFLPPPRYWQQSPPIVSSSLVPQRSISSRSSSKRKSRQKSKRRSSWNHRQIFGSRLRKNMDH